MYPLINFILLNNCRVFSRCAVVSPSRRARVGRRLPTALPRATVFSYTATAALLLPPSPPQLLLPEREMIPNKSHTTPRSRSCLCLRHSSSTTASRELAGRRVGTAYYYGHGLGSEERRRGRPLPPLTTRSCLLYREL
jgi:hypothetical protein